MFRIIITALLAIAPTFAAAQSCVTIYMKTLSNTETQIAGSIVGPVVRYPMPPNGVISVCDGRENDYQRYMRELAEGRANRAWTQFIELAGGEEAIQRQIVDNAGPCPTILNRLANERPRGSAPVVVSCTNGRSYELSNWADERNTEPPFLRYLTVREVSER